MEAHIRSRDMGQLRLLYANATIYILPKWAVLKGVNEKQKRQTVTPDGRGKGSAICLWTRSKLVALEGFIHRMCRGDAKGMTQPHARLATGYPRGTSVSLT